MGLRVVLSTILIVASTGFFVSQSKISPLFIIGTFFNINLAYNPLQDKVDGTKLSSYGKLSVNGKPISGIRSETTGGLVLKNNIVGVGNVKYFKNIGVVNQSDLPDQSEPFFVGGIHDHPFGGNKTKVDYYQKGLLGSFQGYFFFDNKPSGSEGDKGNGNDPKTGYRNVLIDDKNIFLYDKSHPDIKIPF